MTSSGRSSRVVGTRRPDRRRPPSDPLTAAVEVWTSVVAGLESARYAEVGSEYAKLSALLVQQRTAQLLAGAPVGQGWAELSRTAQRALDLLEPLLGAARLLATMPAGDTPSTPAPRRARRSSTPATTDARTTSPRKPAASSGSRSAGSPATTPPAPRAASRKP